MPSTSLRPLTDGRSAEARSPWSRSASRARSGRSSNNVVAHTNNVPGSNLVSEFIVADGGAEQLRADRDDGGQRESRHVRTTEVHRAGYAARRPLIGAFARRASA